MKVKHWIILHFSAFSVNLLIVVLLLVPQVSDLRVRQMDLRILETRDRIVNYVDTPGGEANFYLHILCREELFVSLANVRTAAHRYGLEVSDFSASSVDSFGVDVFETIVRATLTGGLEYAVAYVNYLAADVYKVRHLSLVNTETTSFDVLFSIFHE